MRTTTLASAVASALVLCVSQWNVVSAAFYVCPSPCEAMLLPRDMESLEDCLCHGNVASLLDNTGNTGIFSCPEGSATKQLHPLSFADCVCVAGFTRDDARKVCSPGQFKCQGRYRLKQGLAKAESIADCDCQRPYKKDEASGLCVLHKCPRAGNYIKKFKSTKVNSLADCACLDPFIKNDQSGECLEDTPFECPAFSTVLPNRRAQSFADCQCDWGFVRTALNECERERAAFACPNHSVKRAGLGIGERPRSFADCECESASEFKRNEQTHSCDRRNKDVDGDGRDEIEEDEIEGYTCPPFARAIAVIPHSVEQCECLPGYGWKTPEMTCVRLSGYKCPKHSFHFDETKQVETSFADCECARGYYRDETKGECLEWFLANENGCPNYAFLRHWPLQSKSNCQCIYGLSTSDATQAPEIEAEADKKKKMRQSKNGKKTTPKPLVKKKPAKTCNPPPEFFNVGFSQCPDNAVAISWPLMSPDDCMCMDGFEITPITSSEFTNGDGEGFRCVDPTEAITDEATDEDEEEEQDDDEQDTKKETGTKDGAMACRKPLVKNLFNGECRLPVEQVRALRGKKAIEDPFGGEVLFKGIEYDYVLTEDNVMVIQGDVAIGELVRWPAQTDGKNGTTTTESAATQVLHGYYNSDRDHRWHEATMCFEIQSSATRFESLLREAMDHITAVTKFQFRQCRGNDCAQDDNCAHDFVSIKATASSCYSYIGRIGGGQLLGVSAECGLGNLMHVLLHGVGLHHTIDRMDRDDHVRVAWECLPENSRSNFIVEEVNTTRSSIDTPYDFFSIMHHPPDAFVAAASARANKKSQWCQSLFPIIADPTERVTVMSRMGQRELLAVTDIHAVWKLYPSLQQDTASGDDKDPKKQAAMTKTPDVYESRLHTQDDVTKTGDSIHSVSLAKKSRSWGKRIGSFVGAMVTLLGFGAFVGFAVVEFRRRTQLQGNGGYYTESLLTDKALYD